MSAPAPLVHVVTDDETKGKARELFENMKQATGKVPKWMRVMANCDDILVGFFAMFKATMDDAPVDAKLKWKLAYKVSEMNKCEYCVDVSQMKLKELGLEEMTVEEMETAADEREQVAFKYAVAANEHAYNIDPAVMEEVKKHFNDQELVELTAVVGLFNYINRFNDALGVLPDVE